MSKLQEQFNLILKKIEERIKDEEELNFIKEQIAEISMLYIDKLNKIMDLSEKRVNQVYENQKMLEEKMTIIEKGMNNIQKELFVEEEFDFEIVCPYCNYEFVSDIGSDIKEVECPECHNIIELDWNQEEEDCQGHCGGCHGCGEEDEQQELKEEQQEVQTNNEKEEDEDM